MSSSGLIGGSSGSSGNSGSSGSKGSSSGSAGASAGGAPAPAPTSEAPVCQPIGGGKYNCYVWKETDSYNSSHQQVGILHAGTNYFYCQANLGIRETYGQWTNVWWAKTDDDSHNRNVYVSDVYIKGGANDAPVPGLPLC
jgi:eukaryotic-like serine/threonine-protein kinase